ncbi:hypothetical protein GLAREA_06359 [Glarea lozoyensis ATCC 20868]|uniref:Heterokaryon incompatibility domain-containing protein n=1 Tax=Glarea lozoyensis (strain ATCC 20868 / MF5171) TaxID=1116229 RepID=S3D4I5_GLAL2|nr:uncharacterized protein GLAREA_06359 [Glarea lozoyensis ATCC 20868]EPE33347.1 hypothetical protein GLAREA_06359 [Glarea lozoyensis ATCC 20868]
MSKGSLEITQTQLPSQTTTPTAYSYPPLLSDHSFRLLKLFPGTGPERITVQLWQFELPSAPAYDAISYVWGDESSTISITCDSQPLEITQNLHWALYRVRDPKVASFVWADAICIDQLNVLERNSQVALMGSIYGNARLVFVAMGDASGEDDRNVMTLIRDISSIWEIVTTRLEIGESFRDDPRWRSVASIMDCTWFTRVWVVQEVGLARHPIVLYGNTHFPYRELIKIVTWARSQTWSSSYWISGWIIHSAWSDWTQIPTFPNVGLFDLLSHGAMLSCSDPRDRVYAFLGHPLAKNTSGSSTLLAPDYTKDYREVYQEVSVLLLKRIGLRLLSSVEHTEETIKEPFPSWVVRWDVAEVMNDISQYHDQFKCYPTNDTRLLHNTVQGNKLISHGIFLETIAKSFPMRGRTDADVLTFLDHTSNTEISLHTMIHNFTPGNWRSSEIYGQNPQTAFLKTLSAGHYKAPFDAATHPDEISAIYHSVIGTCHKRCFAMTGSGLFVLAPWLTRPGDICCVLFGAGAPFVLRPAGGSGEYRLLGEAYVGGIMDGELKVMFSESQLSGREFVIS